MNSGNNYESLIMLISKKKKIIIIECEINFFFPTGNDSKRNVHNKNGDNYCGDQQMPLRTKISVCYRVINIGLYSAYCWLHSYRHVTRYLSIIVELPV